jgi:threonylcarbamoyladenosine tRNA methylthiotransferase MtaB
MPQVEPARIKERAGRLREATARRKTAWLQSLVGTTQNVLVERSGTRGHAENFAPISIRSPGTNEVGKIVGVRIAAIEGDMLVGETA